MTSALASTGMQSIFTHELFWIGLGQWLFGFGFAIKLARGLPRRFPWPIRVMADAALLLALLTLVFLGPLYLAGYLPLPCCEGRLAFKTGSGVGIGGALMVHGMLGLRSRHSGQ